MRFGYPMDFSNLFSIVYDAYMRGGEATDNDKHATARD